MRREYDFSGATRKAVIPSPGKTRISIHIDNAILDAFRRKAEAAGTGYQTMMNDALKRSLASDDKPLTEAALRKVLGEMLAPPKVPRRTR